MTTRIGISRARRVRAGLAALVALGLLWSCTTPDTQKGFERFLASTEDARTSADTTLPDGTSEDFSGPYLMAVQTPLGGPILFDTTVTLRSGAGDSQVIDLLLQPLRTEHTLEGDARPDPRTPVGDPLTVTDIPFADGGFTFDLDEVTVPGDANPVTFQDIVANLSFEGVVVSPDTFCGTISGVLLVPITYDLAGSTFGAERTTDVTTAEIRTTCP